MRWTPPALAKEYGVSPDKVLTWIHTGELRALNIATRPTGRPRYVIDQAAVADFEAKRTTATPKPARRRKQRPVDVIEFF
jgi:hypothetical protein